MVKSRQRGRLSTTIEKNLLESLKSLAAQTNRKLNQLLEEAIHDILVKHRDQQTVQTHWSIPKEERREHSRAEVCWPVEIMAAGRAVTGTIKNVSKAGALIQCAELPVTSGKFKLGMKMPDRRFTVTATVEKVRLNLDDRDSSIFSYDLAIRFVEISANQRAVLYNAIRREARRKISITP
jgi:hypothetical protein